MKFGRLAPERAIGAILAHSLRVAGGTYKKGRVLSAADVPELRAAGYEHVVAARLEEGDVGEDDAARALAESICGDGLTAGAAFTGRCNLTADDRGVLCVDRARLDEINLVHESLTVATLAPYAPVVSGQLVCTVKVIPFAVRRDDLERCLEVARPGPPVLRLAAFAPRSVGLVQTQLAGIRDSVFDKTRSVLERRVAALGCRLQREIRCPHEERAVAAAVEALLAEGCRVVLVAGASATVDRRDVVPSGIEMAGGRLVHFGMPVDPGNLLLLAAHGDATLIGLPGCARSPKFNGVDAVLERVVAGLPVQARDIMTMGAGGLLKDTPVRPAAREVKPSRRAEVPGRPRIAGIVLAAGRSTRMGGRNKLLMAIDGRPLIEHALAALSDAGVAETVVVTGFEQERVRAALGRFDARVVHNPGFADGLSTSLAAGVAALSDDIDGALVVLADMPRVGAADLDRLIAAFDPVEGRAICVPVFDGKRGNPVLWSRRFFAEMTALKGDVGAKHLIGEHEEFVCEVEMPGDGVLVDIDSPEMLPGAD